MLIRNVVARHHTMLRRDGNAEKFWSVARRCAAGNQLAAVSDIRTLAHRQSLGSIVYSCAHCTLSGCQTFSHSQERCICSPEFSEHSRMMVASESKHKRQNKRPEKFESIAYKTKDGTMIFTVKDSANVDALAKISCARTRNNASATMNLSTRMVKTARR